MLTRTSQYALQALIHLVRHSDGEPLSSKQIADQTGIPPKYLSTILGALVPAGVLESTRGKRGGFFLTRSAKKISLLDIVLQFEPSFRARRQCPFGNSECDDNDPCMAHFEWKKVIEHERRFLEKKTLHEVAMKQKETAPDQQRRKTKKGTRNDQLAVP